MEFVGVPYLFPNQGAHRRMFDGGGNDRVANDGGRAAPYASWSAVCAVLKRLHSAEAPLPDVIRRRDLDGVFAPTVVKQILAAFRFMGLIDNYHRPTQQMRDLVAAYDTPNWPSALADVVGRSFPELSGLDLGRATREQLDAAFQAYRGSSDEVRKKCVRFFLLAARDAGIPLSVEFSTPYRHPTDAGHPRVAAGYSHRENEARELFPNPHTVVTHPQAQE